MRPGGLSASMEGGAFTDGGSVALLLVN